MNESTRQIVIAVVASSAAAATAALVTHWITKQSTTNDIASGKTPLPAGSTPTVATPAPTPAPAPAPAPAPGNLVNMASQIAKAISKKPYIPHCPPGYHWGGYDADNPNLPKCVPDS
jgi:hypothetical protein